MCAAVQTVKGLDEVEYKSEGVVVNSFFDFHFTGLLNLNAEPISVMHVNNNSINEKTLV